jgi:hypothetical protein
MIDVGKTIITIPQITIFIGALNHSQLGCLWHCFTHIIGFTTLPS